MKTFLSFIQEASASQQAARLGLEGDGHGSWYKDGEFVAKTVKGQLRFYNKRQRVGAKDPAQTELEKNVSDPNFNDPSLQQQVSPEQQVQPEQQPIAQQEQPPVNYLPVEKTKGTLTIAFGRFNPPHLGHLQLMDTAALSADQEGSDYMIVPSRSQDKKKNPLDPDTKVSIMRQMFPQHSERIVNDVSTRTIFDVLKKAHNDGYTNVRIVGGADRVKEFEKLSNNYNGNLYQFDNIEVVSAGDRDPDAEGVEGLSASRMRLAAAEGDLKTFRSGMPSEMRPKDVRAIFDTVRSSMGISDEIAETWEIAPKYDLNSLREQYISNNIFNVGNLVENLNTGIIGRIIRRGTNYLICVSEDNIMFKSWIKDLMEVNYFNKITNKSGVDADNRLVGTDSFRKYVESMVPGNTWGMQFINKYRKK
jgi:phosphopantetheine adenylyltransferase